MKPVLVLVGRPNVGKSTLFNCLTRSRDALVADMPGVTRDRQYGTGRIGERAFLVVDTGGISEPLAETDDDLARRVGQQTRQAVSEADAVLFVLDAKSGLTGADREIASELRQAGRPVWIVVNKCDGMDEHVAVAEFHALGMGVPEAVSAAHNRGVAELTQRILDSFPAENEEGVADEPDIPKIAVIGRPNAGKSTLVNALLGEERVLVSETAGTTRDAIQVPFERDGRHYVLIDTAGVRRRARVEEHVEKISVIRTLQAIESANVVVLVVDSESGVAEQDATLAGYALEQGRGMVLVLNKWDALDEHQRAWAKRELERKLPFLAFAPVHQISALKGQGVGAVLASCYRAFTAGGKNLSTAQLNRVLEKALARNPPPMSRGRRIRPKFAHQAGRYPPTVVVRGNLVNKLPENYRKYLMNAFREAFELTGAPVRIYWETEDNPYSAGRKTRR